jgi:C4-dicarboxylate-specific signal transduction histidine kinase
LIDHDKRRVIRVDLHKVINTVLQTFDPFLKGRDVTPKAQLADASPYLRGSEAAIESILTNLVNNSMTAFETEGTSNRTLVIATEVEDGFVTLSVSDNGPGIAGVSKRDIWLPGITTKPNGTGLGLTIVRDTVTDLGGEVDAIEKGTLGGAKIIVKLPILNS